MSERIFPIQPFRGAAPHPTSIPWSIADKAHSVYRARHGSNQSLERIAERGGFGPTEMDDLLPGWRDEVSELAKCKRERLDAFDVERVVRDYCTLVGDPFWQASFNAVMESALARRMIADSEGGK